MNKVLRVAFFPDSYLEVNGAAMTSKRLVAYAKEQGYPYLCVHAGPKTEFRQDGSVSYLSLKRSPLSLSLDEELGYDPLFQRHTKRVLRHLLEFKPDVLHITGVNDVSIIGVYLAWKFQWPLLGSWHTNIHEFAAHRISKVLGFLPGSTVKKISNFAERKIMDGSVLYYKMPKVVLAPNEELVQRLGKGTKRIAAFMGRGVDTELFSPAKRTVKDKVFRLGSVGRLRAEKSVRMLADIEKQLIRAGRSNFKFLIVGEGDEREYLEKNMTTAEFTGFLSGDALAEAYANMDIFLFPSKTDAFGNVAQEANASGVPAIVSDQGGPKYVIAPDETGFVAKDTQEFVQHIIQLMDNPAVLEKMKRASREKASGSTWNAVFEGVYKGYEKAFEMGRASEVTEK